MDWFSTGSININGVLYTAASYISGGVLNLTSNYTGTTASGLSYTIYPATTEQWKHFGASYQSTGLRPSDLFEDWVIWANNNAIALLNINDDTFNNVALTIPDNYTVACLPASTNGVLVGLNVNNRGTVFLWDAYSNGSIAPWIWFNANIKAIVPNNEGYFGWYVIISRGIYLTNGYFVQPLFETMPDSRTSGNTILNSITPQGATLVGNYLIFLGGDVATGNYNRQRQGVYVFNIQTRLFEFCPLTNNIQYRATLGAIHYDSVNNNIHFGYSTTLPSVVSISQLVNSPPSSAYLISEPKGIGGNVKVAEAAKYSITQNPRQTATPTNTFNLSLKVYNFQRGLWNLAQTNYASTSANILQINGGIAGGTPLAAVGDEVTLLEGANAGQVRHITAISGSGTNAEQWTLDSNLPNNTELNVYVVASPFLLAKKFTFSSITQLRDVYFDIASKYKGKKFLLKLLIEKHNEYGTGHFGRPVHIFRPGGNDVMSPEALQKAIDDKQAKFVAPAETPPPPPPPDMLPQFLGLLQNLRTPRQHLSAAPTLVPKTMVDQIQFYDDGTNRRLYLYINNTWRYVTLT